jgi:hypothetical protein
MARGGKALAVIIAAAAAIVACSSTSTSGGTSSPPDGGSSCDPACVDANTSVAVINLINGLYNQSIAGRSTGSQNVTGPCPLGGTAVITGTTNVDTTHDITSLDLHYALTSCQVNASGAQLTLQGTLDEVGTFGPSTMQAMNYAGTGVTMTGRVSGAAVNDAACSVHIEYNTSSTPQVTGSICGRTF